MVTRIINIPKNFSFYLFGPRQTGKSTLIKDLLKKTKKWEVNLLDSDVYLEYLKNPSLFRKEAKYKIEKQRVKVIFIDEIQKIPILLDEIHGLLFTYPDIRFIVTGSSARKLKRGAANLLAGRLVQRFLHPFTHIELRDKFSLNDALLFGTLPPLHNQDILSKKDILNTYVSTYLREEINAEGIVRNLGGFSSFLDVAASHSGEAVNFSSIARDAGLPSRTVQSYYQILEDTLVCVKLEAWRKSVRKRLSLHPKYYIFDTGVTNAICGRLEIKPDPITHGKLFEQWVILETFRLICYKQSSVKLFYWRTSAGAEVDLVFVKAGKPIAGIEIKSRRTIASVHTSGLRSFSDEYPDLPLIIVCDAKEPFYLGKVEVLPWKNYFSALKKLF